MQDMYILKAVKCNPLGNFDEHKMYIKCIKEKPYPENGDFYRLGCLKGMSSPKQAYRRLSNEV
jgi:hypothetical protein